MRLSISVLMICCIMVIQAAASAIMLYPKDDGEGSLYSIAKVSLPKHIVLNGQEMPIPTIDSVRFDPSNGGSFSIWCNSAVVEVQSRRDGFRYTYRFQGWPRDADVVLSYGQSSDSEPAVIWTIEPPAVLVETRPRLVKFNTMNSESVVLHLDWPITIETTLEELYVRMNGGDQPPTPPSETHSLRIVSVGDTICMNRSHSNDIYPCGCLGNFLRSVDSLSADSTILFYSATSTPIEECPPYYSDSCRGLPEHTLARVGNHCSCNISYCFRFTGPGTYIWRDPYGGEYSPFHDTVTVAATTVPSPPDSIHLNAFNDQLTFTWPPAYGADSYSIRVYNTAESLICSSDSVRYTFTCTVSESSGYYAVVRAWNETGESEPTVSDTFSNFFAPLVPTFGSISCSGDSVRIAWTTVANATGYRIRVFDAYDSLVVERNVVSTPTTLGMTCSDSFRITLSAVNLWGESPATWLDGIHCTQPSNVVGLSCGCTDRNFSSGWHDSWGYSAYHAIIFQDDTLVVYDDTVHTGERPWMEVENGHDYSIRLSMYYNCGETAPIESSPCSYPAHVTDLTLNYADGHLSVNWTGVTGALGYHIIIYQDDSLIVFNDTVTTTIRNVDAELCGAYRAELRVITSSGETDPVYSAVHRQLPGIVSAHYVCRYGSFSLTLDDPLYTDGYQISIYQDSVRLFSMDTSWSSSFSKNVPYDHSYYVELHGLNDCGIGPASFTSNMHMLLEPPIGVTVEGDTTQQIVIRWSQANSIIGYHVQVFQDSTLLIYDDTIPDSVTVARINVDLCRNYRISMTLLTSDAESEPWLSPRFNAFIPPTEFYLHCNAASIYYSWNPVLRSMRYHLKIIQDDSLTLYDLYVRDNPIDWPVYGSVTSTGCHKYSATVRTVFECGETDSVVSSVFSRPAQPDWLVYCLRNDTISFRWATVPHPEITGYRLTFIVDSTSIILDTTLSRSTSDHLDNIVIPSSHSFSVEVRSLQGDCESVPTLGQNEIPEPTGAYVRELPTGTMISCDAVTGAAGYHIQVFQDDTLLFYNQIVTSAPTVALPACHTYHATISAITACNEGPPATVGPFTTSILAAVPSLSFTREGRYLTVHWSRVIDVAEYHLQLMADSTTRVFEGDVRDTSMTLLTELCHNYYASVFPVTTCGASDTTFTSETVLSPPRFVRTNINAERFYVAWIPGIGGVDDHIIVRQDGLVTVFDTILTGSSTNFPALPCHSYQAELRTIGSCGESAPVFSNDTSFIPPTLTTVNCFNDANQLGVDWAVVAYAQGYHLTIYQDSSVIFYSDTLVQTRFSLTVPFCHSYHATISLINGCGVNPPVRSNEVSLHAHQSADLASSYWPGHLSLQWPPIPDNSGYQITIYQDSAIFTVDTVYEAVFGLEVPNCHTYYAGLNVLTPCGLTAPTNSASGWVGESPAPPESVLISCIPGQVRASWPPVAEANGYRMTIIQDIDSVIFSDTIFVNAVAQSVPACHWYAISVSAISPCGVSDPTESGQCQVPCGFAQSFGRGWNLTAWPLIPTNLIPFENFPNIYAAYLYDMVTGNYSRSDSFTITADQGFWLLSVVDTTVHLSGSRIDILEFDVPMSGWVLSGNTTQGVLVDSIWTDPPDQVVLNSIYIFDPVSGYRPITTGHVPAGQGFWMLFTGACRVRIR